jgi:HSP20 family protein
MGEKKEKEDDLETKKDDKQQDKESLPINRNPWALMNTMDKWFLDDPWKPLHHYTRGASILPKDRYFNRLLNQESKISTIDMIDTGKEFKITAEMPGIDKKDLEINVTPKDINICGELKIETKEKEIGWLRRERTYSTICRSMLFPEEVNPDKADAILQDGILEVVIEKKNPTLNKVKRIQIK